MKKTLLIFCGALRQDYVVGEPSHNSVMDEELGVLENIYTDPQNPGWVTLVFEKGTREFDGATFSFTTTGLSKVNKPKPLDFTGKRKMV